jgi:uncharacterized protein YegP (UPF0339 family)
MADTKYPCFWRYKDQSGGYYWIYYAKNGEALARSSESYVNKADCDHCVGLMRQSASADYYAAD